MFAGAKVHRETREVMIPVAQRPNRVLFAYRNGAMNYVKGLRIGDDLSSVLKNAQKVAAQEALLARFPIELDGESVQQRLIVLAHFGDVSMREKIDAVLREFDVEMEVTDNIKAPPSATPRRALSTTNGRPRSRQLASTAEAEIDGEIRRRTLIARCGSEIRHIANPGSAAKNAQASNVVIAQRV